MSASTAIGDVTTTLKELLKSQQSQDMFDVSLKSPADESAPEAGTPKINLFLFQVTENQFARNQEWQPLGTDILQHPPLALDLLYVLTPFANDQVTGQHILGEAMRILHDNAIVAAPHLKGSLEYTIEDLKIDLWHVNLEDTARIWNVMAKPYQLFVAYCVRMVQIDSAIGRPIKRVLEKDNRYV